MASQTGIGRSNRYGQPRSLTGDNATALELQPASEQQHPGSQVLFSNRPPHPGWTLRFPRGEKQQNRAAATGSTPPLQSGTCGAAATTSWVGTAVWRALPGPGQHVPATPPVSIRWCNSRQSYPFSRFILLAQAGVPLGSPGRQPEWLHPYGPPRPRTLRLLRAVPGAQARPQHRSASKSRALRVPSHAVAQSSRHHGRRLECAASTTGFGAGSHVHISAHTPVYAGLSATHAVG